MRSLATFLVLCLVLVACSSGDEPVDTAEPATSPTTVAPGSPPSTVQELDENPTETELRLEPLIQLASPTAGATRAGSDSLFVAEQRGRILELTFGPDGQIPSDPTVIIDLSDRVVAGGEQGLLGIAFSPGGERLFAVFTNFEKNNSLVSWELNPDGQADLGSELAHMEVFQQFSNHNGGQIVFGPDGYLYYGLGDGGGGGDTQGNAQNLATVQGSILRIDPDLVEGGYGIPADNPFIDDPDATPEIWAYGLRNPWRFSFDSATSDLWVSDVGEIQLEEINLLPAATGGGAGANLGWNVFEGSRQFAGTEVDGHVPPVLEYEHDGRCSVIGGFVYRGESLPGLDGIYLYSDFCDGIVRGVLPGVGSGPLLTAGSGAALSFAEGSDGEIYLLEGDGTVSRLEGQSS
jgi:glucose/arabinose dehydrogenase